MGYGQIFLKSLGDASFNKDLSNEHNFDGSISLDSIFKYLEDFQLFSPKKFDSWEKKFAIF